MPNILILILPLHLIHTTSGVGKVHPLKIRVFLVRMNPMHAKCVAFLNNIGYRGWGSVKGVWLDRLDAAVPPEYVSESSR